MIILVLNKKYLEKIIYLKTFCIFSGLNAQSESQSSQRSATAAQQKQQQQNIQLQQQEHPLMDKENQPNAEKLLSTKSTKKSQNSSSKHDDESTLGQVSHTKKNTKFSLEQTEQKKSAEINLNIEIFINKYQH